MYTYFFTKGEIQTLMGNFFKRNIIFLSAYLGDVFEDLGTMKTADFTKMRQSFVDAGYLET